jgi:hypothetical protein
MEIWRKQEMKGLKEAKMNPKQSSAWHFFTRKGPREMILFAKINLDVSYMKTHGEVW